MKSGVEANISFGLELPNAAVDTTYLLQIFEKTIMLLRVVR